VRLDIGGGVERQVVAQQGESRAARLEGVDPPARTGEARSQQAEPADVRAHVRHRVAGAQHLGEQLGRQRLPHALAIDLAVDQFAHGQVHIEAVAGADGAAPARHGAGFEQAAG